MDPVERDLLVGPGARRAPHGRAGPPTHCVDVLTQVSAARAALHKVEKYTPAGSRIELRRRCVRLGHPVEQRHKVEELVDTIGRMHGDWVRLKVPRREMILRGARWRRNLAV